MQTRSQSKLSQSKSAVVISTTIEPVSRPQSSSPATRSQTKRDAPVFDFTESTSAWLQNKNKLENGMYSYKTSTVSSGITTRSGLVLSA
jgi:hypothetical protein